MTDQGRSEDASASVEFEVLMEFQRHVKNRFDRSRILWFNTAVTTLAQQQKTTPNEVMKQALADFDAFVEQVEKNVGPVPAGEIPSDPGNAPDDEDIDEFDQLLNGE